jgi:hypothetical protein
MTGRWWFWLLAAAGAACTTAGEHGGEAGRGDSGVAPADAASPGGRNVQVASNLVGTAQTCDLPGSFGSPDCNRCLSMRCCPEVDACGSDAHCSSVIGCVSGCVGQDDPGECLYACFGNDPPPQGFTAFDDCVFRECLETCTN